jgi:FMNH2-dependent dimethyl sulfone monooxygenase
LAKLVASSDQYTQGRFCVNVVSGWFKDEFTKLGEPWLEHGERYRRSEEFIRYLREIWTSDHAVLNGDFYRLRDFDLKPKPYDVPGRAHPEIFMGGNSTDARGMGGRVTDWYFMNGNSPEGIAEQLRDVSDVAAAAPAAPAGPATCASERTGSSSAATPRLRPATCCARSSRRPTTRRSRVSDPRSSRRAGRPVTRQGCGRTPSSPTSFSTTTASAPDSSERRNRSRTGCWRTSAKGVNLFLLGFLHFQEDVQYFGREVLPIVRELEAAELERV